MTALLSCVVLGAALALLRRPVFESWHLYRLRSPNLETRLAAARALIALQSTRAIPHLLEQAETHEVRAFLPLLEELVTACGAGARDAVPRVVRALERPSLLLQYETIGLLARPELRSPAAAAGLSQVLRCVESPFRVKAALALAEFGDDGRVAESGLALALEDADPALRKAAREALSAIGQGRRP